MTNPTDVRLSGPLASHRDEIWADLIGRGYSPLSALNLLRLTAHLSRWLDLKRLSLAELVPDRIEAYLRYRRACGYVCWRSPKGLEPILGSLRSRGVVPPAPPLPDDSPCAELLRGYRTYLVHERGIQPETAKGYLGVLRPLLDDLGLRDPAGAGRLSTKTVTRVLLRAVRGITVGYAKMKVTVLRSFLRYLHVRGLCPDLSSAVPAVAGHVAAGLPRALPEQEIQRLRESCDRTTAVGRRDFAVLLLLSRLGLRSCEVAALELDDVMWRRGEFRVRGKGAEGILPLPQDVGEALVDYLTCGRQASCSRRVFLQSHAPYLELGRKAVGAIVSAACVRAGLPPAGAHRLRHAAATAMLRKGASLTEVAGVLRHRSLQTTAIYAKVDRIALRALARPWPGGAS